MAQAALKYGYVSICDKYGELPYFFVAYMNGLLLFYHPWYALGGYVGLLLALFAEGVANKIHKIRVMGALRSSQALRQIQLSCVGLGYVLGMGINVGMNAGFNASLSTGLNALHPPALFF